MANKSADLSQLSDDDCKRKYNELHPNTVVDPVVHKELFTYIYNFRSMARSTVLPFIALAKLCNCEEYR